MRRAKSAKVLPELCNRCCLAEDILENTSGMMVWKSNCDTVLLDLSGDVKGVTGYTKEELIGKPCPIAKNLKDSDILEMKMQGKKNPGKPCKLHVQFKSKDQKLISAEIILTCDQTDGTIKGITIKNGYADDWIEIISTAHAPIFGVDSDLNVNEWNLMAEKITGYSKEEVLDKPFLDLIEREYREPVGTVLYKCLKGENTANYQQQLKTKSGDTRILMINATCRSAGRERVGVIGIAQDITDLVNLQEKALQMRNESWINNLLTIFKGFNQAYVWEYYLDIKNPKSSGFKAVSDGCYSITGMTAEQIRQDVDAMKYLLDDKSYELFMTVVAEYMNNPNAKLDDNYKYTLRNNKRISINVIPMERFEDGITFVGITIDLPEKEQLDLILESSEDLIMIDSGPENIIQYIKEHPNLTKEEYFNNIPENFWPVITYCSPSWTKFNYLENPKGKTIKHFYGGGTLKTATSDETNEPVFFDYMHSVINSNGSHQTLHGLVNGIECEGIISKMGSQMLSITRNIEDRIKRHKAEKELLKQQVAREKDEQANAFDRHETKNGLLSASGQVETLMRIHREAESDSTLYKEEHREEVYTLYSDLAYDLDQTLQTVLSNAMTREIIHNTYKPKLEPYDILIAKQRIKGDNYVWNIYPRHIPEILMDESLFFYILRNGISNANKYGELNGIVTISISIKNTNLEVKIDNLPGDNHNKLISLENHNIIFDRGIRLHETGPSTQRGSRSAGDGAWIMNTCAKLLDGSCNIQFNETGTTFIFTAPVSTCVTNEDIIDFAFPTNTCFYLIDDSRMQRKMLERSISNIGIPTENIYVKGVDMNEILYLETFLLSKLNNTEKYHIIICDENLDYKTKRGELETVLGTKMWGNIKDRTTNKNVLFFTRSANDSNAEIEQYMKVADGIISKKVSKPEELKRIIAEKWLEQIGIATPTHVKSTFNNDLADIIDIYMEDLNEFLLLESSKCTWEVFWSELHKIKGSILTLNEIINSADVVRMIEKLRGNEFDETYDEKWSIVKQGLTDYHRKILMYLQTHGDNQISA